MTPGIIKKLYHTTPVGLTDEDKQEVYPITATSAVYSAPGESSFPNMSLDNILDALNQGYQYMGKATPTTNPGVYNHKVFYLASDPGTYSYFGNIEVSSLTVLKTSGNSWTADVFNITGGGGGGTAAGYIGTTLVQSSPAPQNLGGISQLNLTSGARIYFGETAYIELDQYGFHFSQGIYSDSFVAAGGIGSGGGGGGGGSYTPGNGISIVNDEISVKIGTGLAFDANGNLTATGGGGGGTDLAAVWASLTNSVSDAYANTQINISHIPDITTSKISNLETWISGKGFLTSETDPTVPAWAKAQTPSLYIGTTQVQTSSAAQDLTGILSVKASSANASKFVWDSTNNAWHFLGNLYADGWVSAGGIGGNGSTGYTLGGLDDVTITSPNDGEALVYRDGVWVNAVVQGGGGGSVNAVKMNGTTHSPSATGVVDLGTVITSLSGYATESWVNQQGFLTSYTETDPTVPAWAKNSTPQLYIGYTAVQQTAQQQYLFGIPYINATSTASSPSRIIWDSVNNAWHFYGSIYADGWVSAGGIGSSGSTSGSVVSIDDLVNTGGLIGTLTIDGYDYAIKNGVLWGTYNASAHTVQVTINGTTRTLCIDGYSSGGGGGSTVSWGTESNNTVPLTVNGTSKTLLLSTALSGYATQSWVQQQNYLTSHQAISTLTLNAGSFTAGTWTPTGNGASFNIPTTLDHISDGTSRKLSDYVTLATAQTITGAKTFTTNPVTIGQTSSLSMHQSSYIDIGPIRIKFENNAIHITKVSSSDTTSYGLYADGFISAGGVATS